jgi:preprotein translocase subunit SecG
MWTSIFVVCQVVVAIFMVAFVLLQRGQGSTAGLGGGGGGGAGVSSTVFGARGAGNFLSRTTALLAIGFFGISLALAAIEADRARDATQNSGLGVIDALTETEEVPAANAEQEGTSSEVPSGDTGSDDATEIVPSATQASEADASEPGVEEASEGGQ